METRDQRGKAEEWCQEALPPKSREDEDILADFWWRQEEGSKMKKLDSWEIFQEIGSPTYSEKLGRNIMFKGYFGKFSFYKVEEHSKRYWSI